MMPHHWMIEAMKIVAIADSIVSLLENSKETWITKLIACNESHGEVDIRRGLFYGDYFSALFLLLFFYLYQ